MDIIKEEFESKHVTLNMASEIQPAGLLYAAEKKSKKNSKVNVLHRFSNMLP